MAGETERLAQFVNPGALALRHQLGLVGLAGLVVLPVAAPKIMTLKMTTALFFATFVMTWDFVSGYTGQISFGHALFFGVGGYTSALLNVYLGWHPVVTIALGMVLAAVAALVVGVPALRLEGPYLALLTLVAPLILLRFIILFSPWTGGETGLVGASETPQGTFGARNILDGALPNYYVAFGVFLFALVVFVAITRADAGEVFTAIREDEDAVAAAGLNPAKFKLFAFVVSGAVGGLAGAAFIHTPQGTVSPSQILSVVLSIEVIVATILGGIGTITGAAFGGLFYYFLREQLRQFETVIPVINTPLKELDLLLFFVITLGFLFFLPRGILPWLVQRGRRLLGSRGGDGGEREAIADGGRTPLESVVAGFVADCRAVRRRLRSRGREKR